MRAVRGGAIALSESPDAVFQAALGVVQNTKSCKVLAVHNEGRKLVVTDRSMWSNKKIIVVNVDPEDGRTALYVAVGADPRTPAAVMGGWSNDRGLKKFVGRVQGALDGSAPAPVTPVANHYVQKKTEVPWADPHQEPDIQLGGNLLAMYGL